MTPNEHGVDLASPEASGQALGHGMGRGGMGDGGYWIGDGGSDVVKWQIFILILLQPYFKEVLYTIRSGIFF